MTRFKTRNRTPLGLLNALFAMLAALWLAVLPVLEISPNRTGVLANPNMGAAELAALEQKMGIVNIGLATFFSGGSTAQQGFSNNNLQSQFNNNYLSHTQWSQFSDALQECGEKQDCIDQVINNYGDLSRDQQEEYAQCLLDGGDCSHHEILIAEVNVASIAQVYDIDNLILSTPGYQDLVDIQTTDSLSQLMRPVDHDRFREFGGAECGGLTAASCLDSYKIYAVAQENAQMLAAAGIVVDFIPIAGDLKAAYDCGSTIDPMACSAFVIGIIPFAGDLGAMAIRRGDDVIELATNSETTTLYRAVSPEEYQDIMDTGQFNLTPGAMECKQFGVCPNEVMDFANTPTGQNAAGIVGVEVPNGYLDNIDTGPNVDPNIFQSGTVTIDVNDLDEFNQVIGDPFDALE